MKLRVTIYRVASIPTTDLMAALGADGTTPGIMKEKVWPSADTCQAMMLEKFGPLVPGLRVFWNQERGLTCVGVDVISFDLKQAGVPHAGIVDVNPMDRDDLLRLDGALRSEMSRIGIWIDPPDAMGWRCVYEISGN